jgi:hypothetical protein
MVTSCITLRYDLHGCFAPLSMVTSCITLRYDTIRYDMIRLRILYGLMMLDSWVIESGPLDSFSETAWNGIQISPVSVNGASYMGVSPHSPWLPRA